MTCDPVNVAARATLLFAATAMLAACQHAAGPATASAPQK